MVTQRKTHKLVEPEAQVKETIEAPNKEFNNQTSIMIFRCVTGQEKIIKSIIQKAFPNVFFCYERDGSVGTYYAVRVIIPEADQTLAPEGGD